MRNKVFWILDSVINTLVINATIYSLGHQNITQGEPESPLGTAWQWHILPHHLPSLCQIFVETHVRLLIHS